MIEKFKSVVNILYLNDGHIAANQEVWRGWRDLYAVVALIRKKHKTYAIIL